MSSRRSARLSAATAVQAEPATDSASAPTASTGTTKKRKAASKVESHTVSTNAAHDATTAAGSEKTRKKKKKAAAAAEAPMPPPPIPPSTPTAQSKRRREGDADTVSKLPPPLTPTPSAIGVIAAGNVPPLPHTPSQAAAAGPRPAEPHATNAPLSTPGGTKVFAFPPDGGAAVNTSPLKASLKLPTSTTDTLLADACAHLIKVDPKLEPLVLRHHCKMFSPQGLQEEIEPFKSLVSSIMAQQVSGAAASSIKRKFIALFPSCDGIPGAFPTPTEVAASPIPTLRTAGLSQRKAEYVQGLAEKFASNELSAEMLVRASDEEVLEKLVAVRGLGRWSVEMFTCFALKRMDVFSTGDLGVQRGIAAYLGKDVNKLKAKGTNNKWKYCSEKEMLEVAERFAPYRSLFMWLMWRVEDAATDINAIADED